MKNHTFVAIGIVTLMITGATLAATRAGAQSAQQQEQMREQQERMQQQQEQRQEQMREQQERMRQQQQEQRQEQMREQEQQREQEQTRQREQQQARSQAQPEIRTGYTPQSSTPRTTAPENHPSNSVRPQNRPNLGANHPNTIVARPAALTPTIRHAMTYNRRPGGVHINPQYFAAHFGYANGFHFTRYAGGACIGDCGLRQFGSEWYFNTDGVWFGIIGPMPGNWAFQTDSLYIDIGDDGNYYLYDAQFPDVAVQLTFVQNVGDDQAAADDGAADEADQTDQSQQ